jgi:hypothetical protein
MSPHHQGQRRQDPCSDGSSHQGGTHLGWPRERHQAVLQKGAGGGVGTGQQGECGAGAVPWRVEKDRCRTHPVYSGWDWHLESRGQGWGPTACE